MKTILTVFFIIINLFGCQSFLCAQVSSEKRIEFDLKEDNSNYQVMPFGDEGILVFSQNIKDESALIERYDTDLKSVEKKTIDLPKGYSLNTHVETDNDMNLLFVDRHSHFLFYRVDAGKLAIDKISGDLPSKVYISKMEVSGNYAYLSGKSKKNTILIKLDIGAKKSTIIPLSISGYSPSQFYVNNIQVIEGSSEVMVGLSAATKKMNDYVILKFDDHGNKVAEFNLSQKTDRKITSATASALGNNEYIFTGTYSSKPMGNSEGMYICKTSGEKVNFIKFYNFLDFKEFLSYLPEKQQAKIEKKEARKEKNGDEYAINYLIQTHPIIKMDDKFVFIGEAYYPTYRTESYTTYVNGKATTSYRTVFDGYQYTHATVVGFDESGEKLWDKTFEMWPSYKPYYPKKFISVGKIDDDISLLFASRATIRSISFGVEGDVIHDNKIDLIETGSTDDKIKSSFPNLQYWYDNYFIAHGNQTIKNSEESFGNKKRTVYFINKINYQL